MRLLITAIVALSATPGLAADAPAFQSPSGNIHCAMYGNAADPQRRGGVRCDMRDYTPTLAPRDICAPGWHQTFAVDGSDSGHMYCAGSSVINRRLPVLGYGQSITHAGVICHSARTGMTRTNTEGHGFTIARARQNIF